MGAAVIVVGEENCEGEAVIFPALRESASEPSHSLGEVANGPVEALNVAREYTVAL